jgi:hypothetical protein
MTLKPGLITLAFVFMGRDGVRRYETYLHALLEKGNDKKIANYQP